MRVFWNSHLLLDAECCLFELICEFNLICSYNFGLLVFLHNKNLISPKSFQSLILISRVNFINKLLPIILSPFLLQLLYFHKLFIQNNLPLKCFYSLNYINFWINLILIILHNKLNILLIKNQALFFNSLFINKRWLGTRINLDNLGITITGNNRHRIRRINKPIFDLQHILLQRWHGSRLFNRISQIIADIHKLTTRTFWNIFCWGLVCFLVWNIRKNKSFFFVLGFAYLLGLSMFLVFYFVCFHFLVVKCNTCFLRELGISRLSFVGYVYCFIFVWYT